MSANPPLSPISRGIWRTLNVNSDLEDPCGAYLTFRQLIECGKTQARTGLANRPRQPDSYSALLDLARNVLDPVIAYLGMIRLTYGFCGPEIPGRIAPKRDQHAVHELNLGVAKA